MWACELKRCIKAGERVQIKVKMNVEVEFFKSRERKLVVLSKISVEEQVTDFDATIIFEDEYEIIFHDSKRISKLIEKNYREYMGDKHR